jgi:uncharacterized BrkB/YihY/UPF0761 family membrane protein
LLLVVITIFGFIGAASLGHQIISTLHEFPVVGSQFNPKRSTQSLQGSGIGLAIGLIGLIYSAQGVTQTVQQAMAGVWNVPQVDRPGFAPRLARSLIALAIIGVAFVLNAAAGTLVTNAGVNLAIRSATFVGMLLLNAMLYLAVFRVTTPGRVAAPDLFPGAALASVGFTLLITIGSGLVQHQLRHSSATYGQFGLVIGLVGFLFLLAKISLYGAELNPVVSRHLWPRGVLSGNPTDADSRVLSDIVHQYRSREDHASAWGLAKMTRTMRPSTLGTVRCRVIRYLHAVQVVVEAWITVRRRREPILGDSPLQANRTSHSCDERLGLRLLQLYHPHDSRLWRPQSNARPTQDHGAVRRTHWTDLSCHSGCAPGCRRQPKVLAGPTSNAACPRTRCQRSVGLAPYSDPTGDAVE